MAETASSTYTTRETHSIATCRASSDCANQREQLRYIRHMMRWLFKCLQLPLALLVMFYEWGWGFLSGLFDWLARRPFWAWLGRAIGRLPPYAALTLFVLPSIALFPVKLGALWLVSHGHSVFGAAIIIGAKLFGTALLARIFTLTQPALMRIAWFARFYGWFKPWKDGWMAILRASAPWRAAKRARALLVTVARVLVRKARTFIRAARSPRN